MALILEVTSVSSQMWRRHAHTLGLLHVNVYDGRSKSVIYFDIFCSGTQQIKLADYYSWKKKCAHHLLKRAANSAGPSFVIFVSICGGFPPFVNTVFKSQNPNLKKKRSHLLLPSLHFSSVWKSETSSPVEAETKEENETGFF